MRSATAILFVFLAVLTGAPSPAMAVTMQEWAQAPLALGDKVFTLISTDWPDTTVVQVEPGSSHVYDWRLLPSELQLSHVTRTVTFMVTIVDDPASPEDETLLYDFDRVAFYEDHQPIWEFAEYRYDIDNDSDFGSPLLTWITPGSVGPIGLSGAHQTVYVRLLTEVNQPMRIDYLQFTFFEAIDPVATSDRTWGDIKALFR